MKNYLIVNDFRLLSLFSIDAMINYNKILEGNYIDTKVLYCSAY